MNSTRPSAAIFAALSAWTRSRAGFVVQSLLGLWLFERFGLSLATTGAIFFWAGVLSALSYFAAAWVSERLGLVNAWACQLFSAPKVR